jgi:hypothetical protein
MIITIYGNCKKSHDQTNNIFEFSSKNGSEWYNIINYYQLLTPSYLGNILPRSKLWINQWMKNVTISWNDKERFLTMLRTRNLGHTQRTWSLVWTGMSREHMGVVGHHFVWQYESLSLLKTHSRNRNTF